jgi:hypothetical protein
LINLDSEIFQKTENIGELQTMGKYDIKMQSKQPIIHTSDCKLNKNYAGKAVLDSVV